MNTYQVTFITSVGSSFVQLQAHSAVDAHHQVLLSNKGILSDDYLGVIITRIF